MKSIIDELFYDNLSPAELCPYTKEHKRLTAEHMEDIDRLRKTLGRRQLKRFDAVLDRAVELTAQETQNYFRIGFCLGAQFMREVLEFRL